MMMMMMMFDSRIIGGYKNPQMDQYQIIILRIQNDKKRGKSVFQCLSFQTSLGANEDLMAGDCEQLRPMVFEGHAVFNELI